MFTCLIANYTKFMTADSGKMPYTPVKLDNVFVVDGTKVPYSHKNAYYYEKKK
eukprot:CAMPEP_0114562328 /NCGR_PEP_ID=MMETSP0114-20121206/12469_1 /TAXON_ID=31324 /ORGANISM="Goniomonas sp, Strain m" /LENGTH=52 /DNA_ID=CAMNT_0001748003 /DNA_START=247 /DNA_END=405 /DNA_ORIENTATION=+